ncbi:MAG: DUF4349 domain-containing protein [Patescibacteria group bacterium]
MAKRTKIILGIAIVVIAIIIVAFIRVFKDPIEISSSGYIGGVSVDGASPPPADMVFSKRVSLTAEESMASPQIAPGSSGNGADQSIDRLVIKTGRFSIVVKEVREAAQAVNDYAIQKGGFVVSSDISQTGLAPYATVVIRVPVKVFDEGVGEIKNLGEVESEYIEGQDVTEEFVDLDARLKNLRATENQYLEIMKKAIKIEDILQVQNYLSAVRAEIESLQGRMKYLRESADMSTLTVYLSTDPEVLPIVDSQDKWKPWSEVKTAARSLLGLGKGLSYLIIWFVIYIPLWAFVGLVISLVYRNMKKRKEKKINL